MSFLAGIPKIALPVAFGTLLFPSFASAGDSATDQALPAETTTGTTPAPVRPRPIKRLSDPYARLPAVKIVPGANPTPVPVVTADNKSPLVLPSMTVTGQRDKVPPLPRVFVHPPARNVPEPDVPDFETPAARDARLVKKHFTPFEEVFNRLLGNSLTDMARDAEAAEKSAVQLNRIADMLELSALAGIDDEKEQKKLRAEYLKVLYERPR